MDSSISAMATKKERRALGHLLLGQNARQVQRGGRDGPQAGQAGIGFIDKILARDARAFVPPSAAPGSPSRMAR